VSHQAFQDRTSDADIRRDTARPRDSSAIVSDHDHRRGHSVVAEWGLVEEVPAPIDDAVNAWRTTKTATALILRATALGLAQIGMAEANPDASTTGMTDETEMGTGPTS
jgi:hypothetical protein